MAHEAAVTLVRAFAGIPLCHAPVNLEVHGSRRWKVHLQDRWGLFTLHRDLVKLRMYRRNLERHRLIWFNGDAVLVHAIDLAYFVDGP